jgi:hypothetical protein
MNGMAATPPRHMLALPTIKAGILPSNRVKIITLTPPPATVARTAFKPLLLKENFCGNLLFNKNKTATAWVVKAIESVTLIPVAPVERKNATPRII